MGREHCSRTKIKRELKTKCVGGSFEMTFTTKAESKVQGSQLIDIALKESNKRFSFGLAAATAGAVGGLGVGVGTSNSDATAVNDADRDAEYSVSTSWRTTFIGPKVNDPNSVERILAANPNVWRIVPATGEGRREFQVVLNKRWVTHPMRHGPRILNQIPVHHM